MGQRKPAYHSKGILLAGILHAHGCNHSYNPSFFDPWFLRSTSDQRTLFTLAGDMNSSVLECTTRELFKCWYTLSWLNPEHIIQRSIMRLQPLILNLACSGLIVCLLGNEYHRVRTVCWVEIYSYLRIWRYAAFVYVAMWLVYFYLSGKG